MAPWKMKTLFRPENKTRIVDVIAVRGLSDTDAAPWINDTLVESEGIVNWFRHSYTRTRFSVFSYETQGVFSSAGLQDVAAHLLEAVMKLRRNGEETQKIIFLCHDIGASVVKQALMSALIGDINTQNVVKHTQALFLMGCPQRSASLTDLQEGIGRLFLLNKPPGTRVSQTLARSLAEAVAHTHWAFTKTNLSWRLITVNFSTTIDDNLEASVFRPQQTKLFMGSANSRTMIDVESSEKHALLGTRSVWEEGDSQLDLIETALDSVFAATQASTAGLELSNFLPRFAPQPIDAPLSLIPFRQPLKHCIADSETFKKWASQRNGGLLAIHEPIDPVGTALSILSNHLTGTTKLARINQFFEFRHWDCRYNSVELMLSQFLVEISRFYSLPDSVLINCEDVLHNNDWSIRSLLSAFQEFLLYHEEQEEDTPNTITWVFVDLDEKIKSSQWLLSTISDLITSSESKFKVLIVNRCHLNFGNSMKNIAIITPGENHKPDTRFENSFDNVMQPVQTGDSVSVVEGQEERDMAAWELIAEFPNLYASRRHVFAILDGCRTDTALQETVQMTLRLMARNITSADLDEKLSHMVCISIERLFQLLWMPRFILPNQKAHMIMATNLLFYAARGLSIEEVRDLENRTSYGQQIGLSSHPDQLQHHIVRTCSLLPGLVSVTHDEINFSHPRLRDILSQTSPFDDEKSSQLAHSRIVAWCLERITKATTEELELLSNGGAVFTANLLHHGFINYAIRHWAKHAKLAGPEAEQLGSVQSLLRNRPLLLRWAQAFWNMSSWTGSDDVSTATPLAIFAQHGLDSLLVTYMDIYRHLPTYQRECFEALRQAVQSESLVVVKTLLNSYTISDFDTYDDVLLDAFATENTEITNELIEAAKCRPDGLSDAVRVLEGAAYYGNSDAVELLIARLPPQTLEEYGSSVMLMAVAGSRLQETGTLEVMKLLLDADFGTDDLCHDDEDANALVATARLGNPHLAALLAKKLADTVAAKIFAGKDIPEESKSLWDLFQAALSVAAQNQHHEVIESLLDIVSSKDWMEPPEMIPDLLESTFVVKPKCTSVLLAHYTRPSAAEYYEDGVIDLITTACEKNDVAAARTLMETFGDPNADQIFRLFQDCDFGGDDQLDVIRFLDEKASQMVPEEKYTAALNTAFGYAFGRRAIKIMRYLVQKELNLNTQIRGRETYLHSAAWQGDTEIAQILLDAGADPNSLNSRNETPLHGAYDNAEMLEVLIKASADVNATARDGSTTLLYATRYGYVKSILVLLDYKAETNIQVFGETILTNVVSLGNCDLTTKLLEAGADPLRFSSSSVDNPLLHTCVRDDAYDILKALLVYDIPIGDVDGDGKKALSCISHNTRVSLLELLVGRGATVDPDDEPAGEALYSALLAKNKDAIRYLAPIVKDINFRIAPGGSILHVACCKSDIETVEYLVTMQCDVNRNDPSVHGLPLQAALIRPQSKDRDDIVKFLANLEELDVKQGTLWWGGYLSPACLCAEFDVVAALMERGSPLDMEDGIGRLPIHFALYRSVEFVQLLCNKGANWHARDRMGRTGLHFAVVSGRLSLVKHVLGNNNNLVDVVDADGWTPLLWALRVCGRWNTKEEERTDIVRELLSQGANKLVKGKGLDRTWTAFELSRYYDLDPLITELVKPKPDELKTLDVEEMDFWNHTIQTRPSTADWYLGSSCSACLMVAKGIGYSCDSCPGFYLCFKCYLSKNEIHPGHNFLQSTYNGSDDENLQELESEVSSVTDESPEGNSEEEGEMQEEAHEDEKEDVDEVEKDDEEKSESA